MFWLSFDCFWRLAYCWYTDGTLLVDLWRLVHQWSFFLFWLYQQCTNRQKQSNSKKWPSLYQSPHVYTESAEYTKPTRASYETNSTVTIKAWRCLCIAELCHEKKSASSCFLRTTFTLHLVLLVTLTLLCTPLFLIYL